MSLQLFDALEPAVEAALRASIRRWGVLVPIFTSAGPWQPGVIIDGHHRDRIATEEGCGAPATIALPVTSEEDALELARTLNMDRRQLDAEQRRLIVGDLRSNGHSLRAIAGAVGVSKSQIADDLNQLSSGGQLEQPDRVTGRDGKSRPATRPPIVVPPVEEDEAIGPEEMQAILDELDDDPTDDVVNAATEAAVLERLRAAALDAAASNEFHENAANLRAVGADLNRVEDERFQCDAEWRLLIADLRQLKQRDIELLERASPRLDDWPRIAAELGVDLHRIADLLHNKGGI